MPKGKQRPYPPEYRARMVELVRSGRSPESLEKEFGVTANTIRNWVKQEDLDCGARADGLTSDEKAELAKLRRENKRLLEERDILKNHRERRPTSRWLGLSARNALS